MYKKFIPVSILAGAFTLAAISISRHIISTGFSHNYDGAMIATIPRTSFKSSPKKKTPYQEMSSGYNATARVDVEGKWDFFASASFLYWQPSQDTFRLGSEGTSFTKQVPFDFEYAPGFKVGIGMNLNHDDWALGLEWTRLHTDQTTHKHADTLQPYWITGPGNGTANSIKHHWDFDFDLVDLALSRSFYVGKKLTFMPYLGARLALIEQTLNAKFNIDRGALLIPQFMHTSSKTESHAWELGPRLGIDTNWLLGKGFRMLGNIAASILFAHFDVHHKEKGSVATADETSSSASNKNNENTFRPNLDMSIGFGWGSSLNHHKEHIDLSASYDFLCFWDNNMLFDVVAANDFGNLYLQGLTLKAKLDF